MSTAVTSGIQISVATRYEANFSSPMTDNFVFSYYITIENKNHFDVQLLRRHWFVFDSCGITREVEGAGVVGENPLLRPGESYSYNSACDLFTMRGTMMGFYSMCKLDDKSVFRVEIPKFKLEVPFCLN